MDSHAGRASLVSHWTPMPEWPDSRSLWALYFTFTGQWELHELVADYRERLADISSIDMVDDRWLHLTVDGIGFTDEVSAEQITQIVQRIRQRSILGTLARFRVEAPILDHDAVTLPVTSTSDLWAMREELRAVVTKALEGREPYRLPEPLGGFSPHISICYANETVAASVIESRLTQVRHRRIEVQLDHLSLVRLHRSQRRWYWDHERRIPLTRTRAASRSHGRAAPTTRAMRSS